MSEHVLLLDLRDDQELIARYEAHHAAGAVPPAIARSIRRAGIVSMEIFRTGTRLVMIMRTREDFDPELKAAADASDPDVIAWEALMDQYQQALPWASAGEKWIAAERIFKLEDQPI